MRLCENCYEYLEDGQCPVCNEREKEIDNGTWDNQKEEDFMKKQVASAFRVLRPKRNYLKETNKGKED